MTHLDTRDLGKRLDELNEALGEDAEPVVAGRSWLDSRGGIGGARRAKRSPMKFRIGTTARR